MTREAKQETTRNATESETEQGSDSDGLHLSGHYWDRTSDFCRVKAALSR